jgi:hypothetical protein
MMVKNEGYHHVVHSSS